MVLSFFCLWSTINNAVILGGVGSSWDLTQGLMHTVQVSLAELNSIWSVFLRVALRIGSEGVTVSVCTSLVD